MATFPQILSSGLETKRLQQTLTGKSNSSKRERKTDREWERERKGGSDRQRGRQQLSHRQHQSSVERISQPRIEFAYAPKKQLPRHGKSGAIDSKSTLPLPLSLPLLLPLPLLLLLFHLLLLLLLLLTVDCVSPGQSWGSVWLLEFKLIANWLWLRLLGSLGSLPVHRVLHSVTNASS